MTRRTRLEAKADRRKDWAASASRKSDQAFNSARTIADGIPMGQPVLSGHHSEKRHRRDLGKIDNGMRKGCEMMHKADDHLSRADGIERMLERSIFSDDDDAIQKLEERIKENEEARERIRVYNVSCRRAAKVGEKLGDMTLLSEDQKQSLLDTLRVCPYQIGKGGSFPTYVAANLSQRIKADRDRIEDIRRKAKQKEAIKNSPNDITIVRHEDIGWCTVTFKDKPEYTIIKQLKSAFYRWNGVSWSGRLDLLPESVSRMEQEEKQANEIE